MNFIDERHTFYVGWVLGIARHNGVDAEPVLDDDGNYTDRLAIPLADRGDNLVSVTVVVPPPPPDWVL